MRFRTVLMTSLLVFGFWYVTSKSEWRAQTLQLPRILQPIADEGRLWSKPETARSAGLSSDEQNNIDIYKTARLATVNITSIVYQQDFFMRVFPAKGTGSGFVINENGQILTNNHVVSGSQSLTVTLADKKQYKAKIIGTDPRNDLALIQVSAGRKLPFLRLGDSDGLQVGQKVLAIGNPFGLEGTLTTGIVSSLGRSLATEGERPLEDLVQTDAAINPGNSGGPLLDSHGDVVGINTAIYGNQQMGEGQSGNIGIGFAMPISRAKMMLDEYHAHGKIVIPVLGVRAFLVAGELADALNMPTAGGLLVQDVERGSTAEDSGLRGPKRTVIVGNYRLGIGGDLIVEVDGKPADSQDALARAMTRKRVGDNLELVIIRDGKKQKLTVKLGESSAVL